MIAIRLSVALLALVAATLAGCNPAAKAIGKWELEPDKLELPDVGSDKDAAAALLASMSTLMKVTANLDINADNTWRIEFGAAGPPTYSRQGTWKYLKTDGQTLVLLVQPLSHVEHELKLKFVDADHVEASGLLGKGQSGDRVFPLKRKKTES